MSDLIERERKSLDQWMGEVYPNANLDNLLIPARVVMQIAESYKDWHVRSTREEIAARMEKLADYWWQSWCNDKSQALREEARSIRESGETSE